MSIDKIAEAIWYCDDEGPAQRPGIWDDLGEAWQDYYRRMAQAAVGAMLPDLPCAYLAEGFCGASVDGYCIDGTTDGRCHG